LNDETKKKSMNKQKSKKINSKPRWGSREQDNLIENKTGKKTKFNLKKNWFLKNKKKRKKKQSKKNLGHPAKPSL
jgi:hypothetical protein